MGVGCSARGATRDEPVIRPKEEDKALRVPVRRQISETSSSEVAVLVKRELTSARSEGKGQTLTPQHSATQEVTGERRQTPVNMTASPKTPEPEQTPVSTFKVPEGIASLPEHHQKVLMGHIQDVQTKVPLRTIQLFLYSLRADGRRVAFLSQLSVKLRTHCAGQGFDLDIVDLSTGVLGNLIPLEFHRDELSLYLKSTLDFGVKQLHVIILGDDLGEVTLPSRMASRDFLTLFEVLEKDSDKEMLADLFKFDESSQTYTLHPIKKEKKTGDGKDAWGSWIRARGQVIQLMTAALPEDLLNKYCKSCLEVSIDKALSHQEEMKDNAKGEIILITGGEVNLGEKDSESRTDSGLDNGATDTQRELLKKRIENIVDNSNILHLSIRHSDDGDTAVLGPSSKTIQAFCDNLYSFLTVKVDQIIDKHEQEMTSLPLPGGLSKMYNEICEVYEYCRVCCSPTVFQERPEIISRLQSYVESSSSHVLVLTGATGSGKTRLMANFALHAAALPGNHCAVVRFVGQVTSSASSLDQVFRSIAQQIHTLLGTPFTQGETDLPALLAKVPSSCPLLVILDGTDQCPRSEKASLDWLPNELPSHVKMVVSTRDSGHVYEQLKGRLPDVHCYLDIPPLKPQSALAFLQKSISGRTSSPPSVHLEYVKENIHKCTLPMQITLISCLMQFCSREDIDDCLGANMEDVVCSLMQYVEKLFPQSTVGPILGYLCMARHGLTESELRDILSCDELVLDALYRRCSPAVRTFPTHVWILLRETLGSFIDTFAHDGRLFYCLRPGVFKNVVHEKHCIPHLMAVHSSLADYFNGRWSDGKEKPFVDSNGVIDSLADRYVLPQPLTMGGIPNIRKLSELPYHVFHSAGSNLLCKEFLFNAEWLLAKVSGLGVESVLQDVDLCQPSESSDFGLLGEALGLSAHALTFDVHQFGPQLQQRLLLLLNEKPKELPFLRKLIDDSLQLEESVLVPSEVCVRQVSYSGSQKNNDADDDVAHVTRVVRIPGDVDHVISLSEQSGDVAVWNVQNLTVETKLTGLKCPRNLRLFDKDRAAVLCDREISIYNMASGELESKLKGVLNANMPFYGIHDNKHVVSLSRNRMYVNITNTDSGDMVSTFKVGESRFLDSLLVSANGVMAVCGDETQKPFPLLVWNLPERKLVHDLRIPRHEFVTAISDISDDGHYVACVTKELDSPSPNFVVVYDLVPGQVFKKWKPERNTTCLAISTTGKSVIIGLEDGSLMVCGLMDGSLRHEIEGRGGAADSITLSEDGDRAASLNRLSVRKTVCMYDLNNGTLMGSFTPDSLITCCQISARGEVVLIGLADRSRVVTLRPYSPPAKS